jgi:hypothetical protein
MTPDLGARDRVFISYSHKDARWLQRIQVHFSPLERQGKIQRWDDTMITPGTPGGEVASKIVCFSTINRIAQTNFH